MSHSKLMLIISDWISLRDRSRKVLNKSQSRDWGRGDRLFFILNYRFILIAIIIWHNIYINKKARNKYE